MRHLDADTVHSLLEWRGLVEALRKAHRHGAMPQVRREMLADRSANQFVNLTAWAEDQFIAVKLVGVFPANPGLTPAQPSVQGIVVLLDGKTGAPVLTADGAALTFRKTAADSALGADILARRDARTLLMVGAGGLAAYLVEAHRAVRPSIERIIIWNRNGAKAAALAEALSIGGLDAAMMEHIDDALSQADIVSCATMATEPLVKGALLKAGAHVDLVGSYLPHMREADDETLRRARRLYVDTFFDCERAGDVAQPLQSAVLRREDIVADLFDLCSGQHGGRRSDDEITVYKNGGGPHLDLFTAAHLAHSLKG